MLRAAPVCLSGVASSPGIQPWPLWFFLQWFYQPVGSSFSFVLDVCPSRLAPGLSSRCFVSVVLPAGSGCSKSLTCPACPEASFLYDKVLRKHLTHCLCPSSCKHQPRNLLGSEDLAPPGQEHKGLETLLVQRRRMETGCWAHGTASNSV